MKDLCFWAIGNGKHALMLQTLVNSFHAVGMQEDFHVFSDRKILGATTHPIKKLTEFERKTFFFKFTFLRSFMKELNYRYFVFLDADNYFVRKMPSILGLMQNSPIHASFESDCTLLSKRKIWHDCPLPKYVEMMRQCGVTSESVYNVNGGFFIVKKEAIELVCSLAEDFWKYCASQGYVFTEEPSLAYAMHMLCEDPKCHLLRSNSDIWCSDWTGHFAERLPDDKGWMFSDYMNEEKFYVNPAIVHAIKSKEALIAKNLFLPEDF